MAIRSHLPHSQIDPTPPNPSESQLRIQTFSNAATGRPIVSIASMAAASTSSCSSAGASWRERRRDPDDPPAVDLPPSTAPVLAQRLAEALDTLVRKALDPGPEEKKAAAAVVAPRLLKEEEGYDAQGDDAEEEGKEGGSARFGGRRPRLAER